MLSHTVSYTVHINVDDFLDKGLTFPEIFEEMNKHFSFNRVSPSANDGHIDFEAYNEYYKSDLETIEGILQTMVKNKKHHKKVECPHCGSDVTELLHGYCMDCSKEKQLMLNHILDDYKQNE